ncbi:MAG: response regulator transcription factor [Anaerolineae bacterium]|nr:response regulator transcription factor [Anaerolineae bacterium]
MILLITDNIEIGSIWYRIISYKTEDIILADITYANADLISQHRPSLIIVDIYSPHLDQKQFLEDLRAKTSSPILVLVADSPNQMIEIYRAGADDCISKPFDPRVLLTKVEVWTQRVTASANLNIISDSIQVGSVKIDLKRKVWIGENKIQVNLSNLEFKLLALLMRHSNKVIELPVIVRQVWGYSAGNDPELVKHLVHRVRYKIEPKPNEPRYILTVFGQGYKFEYY